MSQIELKYVPEPKQFQAHMSSASYILYGGAVAGGKSVAGVNDMLQCALDYEGTRVGIFRWENKSFMDTTYQTMKEWILDVDGLVMHHDRNRRDITLCNGSHVIYGGLMPSGAVSGDIFKTIKSLEIAAAFVDEVTDVPENVFSFLCSRLPRLPGGPVKNIHTGVMEYPPVRLFCSCNPSLGWVKIRWVDQNLPDHEFISAKATDNSHNPPGYYETLRRTMPPGMVQQFVEGDWDAVVDFAAILRSDWLIAATKRRVKPTTPVEFGVDVAAYGDDRSIVVMRQGLHPTILLVDQSQSTAVTREKVEMLADQWQPEAIKIDSIGVGQGLCDEMSQNGYPVVPMIGGASADDDRFANARAEWYWEFRGLLERGEAVLPSDCPELVSELGGIRYQMQASDRKIIVESKDKIKKRLGKSPDYADAFVYCYYGAGFPRFISALG